MNAPDGASSLYDRKRPATDPANPIPTLPHIIFLKSALTRFIVIWGNVKRLISSMMPTKRIESTIVSAIRHIIAYSMKRTGRPCVRAKSASKAT